MKKLICFLFAALLVLSSLGTLPVAAAGSVSAIADQTTVTVGGSVTVTLKYDGGDSGIASMDATFHYNAKSFEYVSCSGATANGQAGIVTISYFATEAVAPKSLTLTLTFKATAAGNADFSLKTGGMWNDDEDLLGTPSATLSVSATNPTLSGDANLASLKPSKGTLTPKFDPAVVNYTISVDYTVTSLSLSATTSHGDAKTAISGANALEVGKNTRVVTVTAPNGTTKKYTVVITRAAQQTTTTTTKKTSGNTTKTTESTTTTTAPPVDLDVEVNGVLMSVSDTQPAVDLPSGFSWDIITVNEVDVPAAKHEKSGMLLLYLTNHATGDAGFYIYDSVDGSFALFRELKADGASYVLHDLPDSETVPLGTVLGTLTLEEDQVTAYVYENADLADFCILWVTAPNGQQGLYTYDRKDGSLQRYHSVPQPEPDVDVVTDPEPEPEPTTNAFMEFINTHRTTILIIAAACAALALLIAAVVIGIRGLDVASRNKGRH
ncbi:MAG: cadherin-like beta sandwich domain-containing protein [Clostridia bacterium]|nr:cadherin-like beta sandwich domain-containing protein [Clostridia bacterium]